MTQKEPEESPGNDIDDDKRLNLRNLFYDAIQLYHDEESIAKYIKEIFDKKYFPEWMCIVGKDFGSAVTSIEKTHCIEKIGPFTIELWKIDKPKENKK